MGKDDFVVPLSEEDRRNARRLRGREGREEADDLLAQARAQGRSVTGAASYDDDDEETVQKKGRSKGNDASASDGEEKAETVTKVMKTAEMPVAYVDVKAVKRQKTCWLRLVPKGVVLWVLHLHHSMMTMKRRPVKKAVARKMPVL